MRNLTIDEITNVIMPVMTDDVIAGGNMFVGPAVYNTFRALTGIDLAGQAGTDSTNAELFAAITVIFINAEKIIRWQIASIQAIAAASNVMLDPPPCSSMFPQTAAE